MKALTHGSNINFQCSAKEMYGHELEDLLREYLIEYPQVLFGKINLEKGEIYQYGWLKRVEIREKEDRCAFLFRMVENEGTQAVEHPFEDLLLSQEACFDILDDQKGRLRYRVIYLTFIEHEGGETTYFIADGQGVSNPLACVAEFWQQVYEVGRDVDFNLSGCSKECGCE